MKNFKRLVAVGLALLVLPGLSACALAVGAVAGGTAVYILKDEGYEVQSPVSKKK